MCKKELYFQKTFVFKSIISGRLLWFYIPNPMYAMYTLCVVMLFVTRMLSYIVALLQNTALHSSKMRLVLSVGCANILLNVCPFVYLSPTSRSAIMEWSNTSLSLCIMRTTRVDNSIIFLYFF